LQRAWTAAALVPHPTAGANRLLTRLAKLLEERAENYGRLITAEMGKPLADSIFEIKNPLGRRTSPNRGGLSQATAVAAYGGIVYESLGRSLCSAVERTLLASAALLQHTALVGNTALIQHANRSKVRRALENLVRDAGGPGRTLCQPCNPLRRVPPSSPIRGCGPSPLPQRPRRRAVAAKPPSRKESGAGTRRFRSIHRSGGRRPAKAVQLAVTSRYFNNSEGCICAKRFLVRRLF